jgi:hypothetical protein
MPFTLNHFRAYRPEADILRLEWLLGANLPGFWRDLSAHEVRAVHQFIETRTAQTQRSSAKHALDTAPQDHGVDRRFQRRLAGRSIVVAKQLLAEVTPRLVNGRIAAIPIHRLGRQRRQRFDRIGPLETPERNRGGEGDKMQNATTASNNMSVPGFRCITPPASGKAAGY